jgi:hypothetical protein
MIVAHRIRDAVLTRLMGGFFGVGAACFLVGPMTPYASLVGSNADAVTLFIGSLLFTLGGFTQCALAYPERSDGSTGRATWRTAWIQSVGTLLFNLMTFEAVRLAAGSARYDVVIWTPNAIGSVCFLISGTILYLSSPRRSWLPDSRHHGWWEPMVNLLGCVFFGISAVAGYAAGAHGALLSASISNWTTMLGAACFLACALAAGGAGYTLKAPRLRTLRTLEREVAVGLERTERLVSHELTATERELVPEVSPR